MSRRNTLENKKNRRAERTAKKALQEAEKLLVAELLAAEERAASEPVDELDLELVPPRLHDA